MKLYIKYILITINITSDFEKNGFKIFKIYFQKMN